MGDMFDGDEPKSNNLNIPPLNKEQEAKVEAMVEKMKADIDKKFYGELLPNTGPMTFASEESIAKFKAIDPMKVMIEAEKKIAALSLKKLQADILKKIGDSFFLPPQIIGVDVTKVTNLGFMSQMFADGFASLFISPPKHIWVRRTRFEWDRN